MLIEKPKFLFFATATLLFVLGYSLYLEMVGDPRFVDHALEIQEAYWWELILIATCLITVFSTWFSAMHSAFKQDRKLLVALILFIWPLSLIYGFWRIYAAGYK